MRNDALTSIAPQQPQSRADKPDEQELPGAGTPHSKISLPVGEPWLMKFWGWNFFSFHGLRLPDFWSKGSHPRAEPAEQAAANRRTMTARSSQTPKPHAAYMPRAG